MLKRCIMIIPEFENGGIIDEIRKKYDPLANHVRPHVTLVFPFESDIASGDLREHVSRAVSGFAPFGLTLNGIIPMDSYGKYLFLLAAEGRDEIIGLHKRLYTGILEKYYPERLKGNAFVPHMTVGYFDGETELKKAAEETKNINDSFKTVVREVFVEIIEEDEDSKIEFAVPLRQLRTPRSGAASPR